jgi:hypothetical protein
VKKHRLGGALGCALALTLSAEAARALPISLSLVVTTSQPVPVGGSVDVEVQIAGLVAGALPSLRAYDLTISFDETVLDFASIVFTSVLGTPGVLSLTSGPTEGTGTVQFSQVSLLSNLIPQPDAFTLATLSFDALAEGDGDLDFTGLGSASLSDQSGGSLSVSPFLGSVTGASVIVPEPTLLGLVAAAGLAASVRKLRRRG